MITYHYYATHEDDNDEVTHMDGIAELLRPIATFEDYKKMKQEIAKSIKLSAEGLTIISLSLVSVACK